MEEEVGDTSYMTGKTKPFVWFTFAFLVPQPTAGMKRGMHCPDANCVDTARQLPATAASAQGQHLPGYL